VNSHSPRRKNAAADGTLVDAARGQALASRSSCHRVFRSRGPFEPGPGFVRNQDYPDLVAVTFFSPRAAPSRMPPPAKRGSQSGLPRFGGCHLLIILGNAEVAVEVKSTDRPASDHLKGLRAWQEEHPRSRCILVCRAPRPRRAEPGIEILPWREFLGSLWRNEIRAG